MSSPLNFGYSDDLLRVLGVEQEAPASQGTYIVPTYHVEHDPGFITIAGGVIAYSSTPSQRPLRDEDFATLFAEMRATLATSARVTEAVRDRIGQDLHAINSSLQDLRAVVANRRLVPLSSLGSPRFKLRLPVFVEVSQEDGVIVAHSADFEQYGSGDTEYEALDNLRLALADTMDLLLASRDQLAPGLQRQLARFVDLVEVLP